MTENVIPLRLTAPAALKIIREIAADSGRVVTAPHAKKRMKQRRITMQQVLACLQRGNLIEGPALMPDGDWRCTLQRLIAGDDVTVVAEFNSRERLLVVTVF
jgi:hypothetical protein